MSKLRNVKFRNSPAVPVRSVSAAYTIDLNSDYVIAPNTTAASRTITLPPIADAYDALSQTGREFIVFKPIAANSVVVEGNATETINGAANQTLTTQYSYAKFIAGATEWMMVETDLIDAATLSAGSITSTMILDGTIAVGDMGANSIDSAQYVDGSIDPEHLADAAVTPVKQNITPRVNAAGDNVVIATTDRAILFSSDGGGAATIDASAMLDGQSVWLTMSTFDTDAYTCANVNGATTLTFNATGETALLYFDGTLLHAFLAGATLV